MQAVAKPHLSTANLLKIGLLANAFEWYEFSVFGYLSAVIGQLFFQSDTRIAELLQVFTLFAVSYLIRPLGSLCFGMLGDRRGRRYSLRLSLILMTVPTVFIGLLPTYTQVGISATVMLIGLRMIQGFAMGGELPATACYVFEAAPPQNKSLFCATVGTATKVGLLLGSCTTYLLIRYFDQATLLDWGWRIPFWLGAPLTFFIAYIRRNIQETADFDRIEASNKTQSINWYELKRPLIQAISLCTFLNVGFPILTIWMPFYLNTFLAIPMNLANLLNTISLCTMVPLCLGAGYLSKYIGYRSLFVGSIIATLILSVPIFWGLQTYTDFAHLMAFQFALALCASIGQGIFVEMVGDLFPPKVRSLGFSLSFILPAALIGGTIPLLCTHVIHKTGWLMFPAFYIILSGLVALPAALMLKRPAYSTRDENLKQR
jgi:MHS family proline/betaine transporter-like MFS transporter